MYLLLLHLDESSEPKQIEERFETLSVSATLQSVEIELYKVNILPSVYKNDIIYSAQQCNK